MPSYLFWASVNFFLHLSQGDFKVKYDRPRCLWSVSFTRNEPQLALQLVKVCHLKPSHLHLKLRNWTKFFVHVHEIFSSIFYIFRIKFWAGIYLDFVFEHRRRPDCNVARKYVSIVPTYVLTYLRHKYALDIYAQDPSKSCRISYLRYLLDIA